MAKVVDVQCGYDYRPGAVLNSQMSLRYCLAVALLDRLTHHSHILTTRGESYRRRPTGRPAAVD